MKNPLSFYFTYSVNSSKKDSKRRFFVTAVCAVAVAFSAMCMCYLNGYFVQESQYLETLSQRQLIVYNCNSSETPYGFENSPISPDKVDDIKAITEIEIISPLIPFWSTPPAYTKLEALDMSKEEWNTALETELLNTINIKNANGLSTSKSFNLKYEASYLSVSFPSADLLDDKALYLDESIENGAYITLSFLERLGLKPEDLQGLTLSYNVWVDVAQQPTIMYEYDSQGVPHFYKKSYLPFSQEVSISVKVRGIIPTVETPDQGDIFLPTDFMIETLENCPRDTDIMNLVNEYAKKNSISENDVEPFSEWSPSAYFILVKSIEDIEAVKNSLQEIDPNFKILHSYQDIEAGIKFIQGNKNIAIYISFVVLAVSFLLLALIYVSLIDRRKFEFSILRANGLTRKEIRNIIYVEMLIQFIKIFLISIIFSALIYLIGKLWLKYPFEFGVITVVYLFMISLLAIVIPTLISLFQVNKFEPDQVMRY